MNGWGWFFAGAPLWMILGGFLSYQFAARIIKAAQIVAARIIKAAQIVAADLHLAVEKIKGLGL